MDREKNWRTNLSCPRIDFQTKTRIIEYESLHFSSPLSLCYESEVDFLTNLFPSYRLLHPCWNKPAAASLAVRAPQVKPRNQTSGLASNKSLKHHFRICGLYQTIYIYQMNSNDTSWCDSERFLLLANQTHWCSTSWHPAQVCSKGSRLLPV